MPAAPVVQEGVDRTHEALLDELTKIGASRHRMTVPQSRSGRRPMSVETMLRKDREGTLFKTEEGKRPTSIKEAATRAVREWRAAAGAGDQAGADQIAAASGQLGLKPRFLENISGGGMEAGVDKMMGSAAPTAGAPAPNEGGYLARKLYKPDSPIATGKDTTNLLALKQQYTDTARSLSPQARQMVPAMYGFKELQGPAGQIRHISDHEYVPNLKGLEQSASPIAHAQRVQDVVAKPMAARGMPMGDIARPFDAGPAFGTVLGGNASNVGMTAKGPKIVDFLPNGKDSPVSVAEHGPLDIATPAQSGGGRSDTKYNAGNVNQLRRDVFRPQAPAPKPAVPAGGGGWSWGGAPAAPPKPALAAGGTALMPNAPKALGLAKTIPSPAAATAGLAKTIPAVPKALAASGGGAIARAARAFTPVAKTLAMH